MLSVILRCVSSATLQNGIACNIHCSNIFFWILRLNGWAATDQCLKRAVDFVTAIEKMPLCKTNLSPCLNRSALKKV